MRILLVFLLFVASHAHRSKILRSTFLRNDGRRGEAMWAGSTLSVMYRKSRQFAVFLACISAASLGCAQALDDGTDEKKARQELCQKVLCRAPTTVRIRMKDGVLEVPLEDVSPIVLPNGWVTILPGEEVQISFDVEAGVIGNPRAVKPIPESKNTLSFRFTQDAKSGDSMLVIKSALPHDVKFDLGMMLPDSNRIRKTSSCPVMAGKSLYEHWPQPIFQFVVARFRVLAPENPRNCD